jgi:hypothetical protein
MDQTTRSEGHRAHLDDESLSSEASPPEEVVSLDDETIAVIESIDTGADPILSSILRASWARAEERASQRRKPRVVESCVQSPVDSSLSTAPIAHSPENPTNPASDETK